MSLSKSPVESTEVAIPFRVRLEPYLIESICELARLQRDKGHQQTDISGLLFGRVEDGTRTVEALKTFADVGTHSELARRERWENAYRATLEDSKRDPELSAFDAVGWFSFRTGSGLLSSDVAFHNQHFRRPEDVALVVWRDGPSQITAELYSKSEKDILTSDDYRWGSVRLSADIRHMREPVELAMRVKMSDDSYLRTYESGERPSQLENLRRKAEAASERMLGFLYRRKEDSYTERVRGYLGDGRLPIPIQRQLEGDMRQPNLSGYFNPYSEAAIGRSGHANAGGRRPGQGTEALSPADSPNSSAWPGSGAAFGTAPAKIPELAPDVRLTQPRTPGTPPFELGNSPFELANIGRTPRTGRAPQNEISGLPMVMRPAAPQKSFPWGWAIGLFAVCSCIVFALLSMVGLQNDQGRLGQLLQAVLPGRADLGLKVRNEDDRLRLSWNQRNRAVVAATDATLEIFDGQQHREIRLDGQQVADGSVLYRPLTSDVTFRLNVRGEKGEATGNVRVLDGLTGRQEVLDVSAPVSSAVPMQSIASRSPLTGDQAGTSYGSTGGPGSDPTPPRLIRENGSAEPAAAQQAPQPTTPPIVDAPYIPQAGNISPAGSANRAAVISKQRVRPTKYETPLNVGPLNQPGSGSTINGWDTASARSRNRQKLPNVPVTAPAPVPATTGYVPPRPVMQVMPNTHAIPNGSIQTRTRVEVQVDVDQTGHVATAHLVSTGINEKISSSALAAARQWTFDPASNNGQRVNSEHTIVFEFRPDQR